jgi:fatty-acyl-CoA synthase
MHPYQHALEHPDKSALVVADTGEILTYAQLDEGSNRGAQLFRKLGLKPGDAIAVMLKNGTDYAVAYWAAQRSGLMTTPISTHLKPAEAAYIVADCGAKVLITDASVGETPRALTADRGQTPNLLKIYAVGDTPLAGAESWREALAAQPATPIPDQVSGFYLPYSGGTTGRPKGIRVLFESGPIETEVEMELNSRRRYEGLGPLVTFTGAPLYHAAPLFQMVTTLRFGGTLVTLRRFDAEQALRAIQDWKVTYAQMVPTMFVRLLSLSPERRAAYDLSSLRRVVHAAAPCPVEVKKRMLAWLGPIIDEYYSGSEAIGQCYITAEEWLRKPGSVGRATWGRIHISGDDGEELPPGQEGLIYFEGVKMVEYRNDPEKSAKARHPQHPTWSTLGDIGYLDEDGYLFLCDRKDFMIIRGGVNIYPQAIENVLIEHPKVADAAVIGVPSAEFGEDVKAVIQLKDPADATPQVAADILAFCRAQVSDVSRPRSVDFVDELPRLPTGKLAKHEVRKKYWAEAAPVAAVRS